MIAIVLGTTSRRCFIFWWKPLKRIILTCSTFMPDPDPNANPEANIVCCGDEA
jgi:hypothetical protein